MTDVSLQKRLAAEVLGVGVSRIRVDPARISDVAQAITREDVKKLIEEGAIWVEPEHGIAGTSSKIRHLKRRRGHRRGHGKRKGAKGGRRGDKEEWVSRIRKIRRFLKYLRDRKIIDRKTYRRLYMLAKGGYFSSFSAIKTYLREQGLVKEVK
ncbi:MAG: 50S ribosomal protein L19e [Desulfurococcaceae archaeon]|nr:50S ribosomal protein L19e [Desulfurococcaceae archaeon]